MSTIAEYCDSAPLKDEANSQFYQDEVGNEGTVTYYLLIEYMYTTM